MTPQLVILIVSHNARRDLEACIRSLHEHPPTLTHQIVVIDNASTDGSPEAVRRAWPDVEVVDAGSNLGFARANNLGFGRSQSELVLLLNSDTSVPAGAIDRMVTELRLHPEAAIVGPRLVDATGKPEISFGAMIAPWSEARQKALVRLHERGVPLISRWVARRLSRPHTPDWVSGACLLVRRTDAESAGLLDERYFMYCEDVDFCAAVRALGRLVRFTPDAEVVHLRGRSRSSAPAATKEAYRRSQVAFYAKHHPRWLALLRTYLRLTGKLPPRLAR